jgi:chromate transporter
MLEVFTAFLKLGLSSFGGPIAHIGYFHREFVERRRWVDEARYAQLLAVSQFLPGPASSQVGFSLGILRAGWRGGLAAFVGFTLPSALLMFGFAYLTPRLDQPYGEALLHAFKLVAVAVVAQGVLTMAQKLTPDAARRLIAVAAALVIIFTGSASMQVIVVALGAVCGLLLCRDAEHVSHASLDVRYTARTGALLLGLFAVLLMFALLPQAEQHLLGAARAFYRTGALVFGGAHVVLPLLEEAVVDPGWISEDEFLAGYGAAQAVPGPMFSVAAFLGARLDPIPPSALSATVSLLAIFLPGLLLVAGVLPMWSMIASHKRAASALAGINAAVVGLLGAALYDPVWKSAILTPADFAIALASFTLLQLRRTSVLFVLAWCVAASLVRTMI